MRWSRDAALLSRWPLYQTFRSYGYPRIRPMTMSFVVTDRCNSRCSPCLIGTRYLEDPKVAAGELTLDEYRQVFASVGELEWVTLGGGEPFMRPDFAELSIAAVRAMRPRVVNVPTNATLMHATEKGVASMLEGFGDTRLVVNVSVDGVGPRHDELRGFEGNFERLTAVVAALRGLRDPRLTIGVNTVISAFNVEHARETVDWVLDELRPDSYVVEAAQIREEYWNREVPLRAEGIAEALGYARGRLETARRRGIPALVKAFRLHYYDEAIRGLGAPSMHRCFSGFATCAMMPKGDVVSSTGRADPMGNVRDFDLDFGALWRSPRAERARARVRASPCACESSNVSYPNALFDPAAAARVAWNALRYR